jgi:hypothetical protein
MLITAKDGGFCRSKDRLFLSPSLFAAGKKAQEPLKLS